MGNLGHYVIRGGIEGRKRLKILARIMHAGTAGLLKRVNVSDGMACIDFGCGSGDVSIELSRLVGPSGKVVGADIDETKIELARQEASQLGISNLEFRVLDIRGAPSDFEFDVVYTRFLLTHLNDPADAIDSFYRHLKPAGLLVVEDIDFSGYFVFPESKAFQRFHELYSTAVQRRGGDPNIGKRLPLLLKEKGFTDVDVSITQPIGIEGEVKLMNPLTMEGISQAVLEEGLATREEITELVQQLYDFAADTNTVAGVPRVIQAWGRKPAV